MGIDISVTCWENDLQYKSTDESRFTKTNLNSLIPFPIDIIFSDLVQSCKIKSRFSYNVPMNVFPC